MLPNPSIWGQVAQRRLHGHLMSNVKHHEEADRRVSTRLSVNSWRHRAPQPTLLAVHLYGSAVDGGLKPHSDIDLLVTVTVGLMKQRGEL